MFHNFLINNVNVLLIHLVITIKIRENVYLTQIIKDSFKSIKYIFLFLEKDKRLHFKIKARN